MTFRPTRLLFHPSSIFAIALLVAIVVILGFYKQVNSLSGFAQAQDLTQGARPGSLTGSQPADSNASSGVPALAEFSANFEILAAILTPQIDEILSLADVEADAVTRECVTVSCLLSTPPGETPDSRKVARLAGMSPSEFGIDRTFEGTVSDSVRRRAGLFESTRVSEVNAIMRDSGVVQTKEAIVDGAMISSIMVGKTSAPNFSAPVIKRTQSQSMSPLANSSGPSTTLLAIMSEARQAALGGDYPAASFTNATCDFVSPTEQITRALVRLDLRGGGALAYELDFDSQQGGRPVRFQYSILSDSGIETERQIYTMKFRNTRLGAVGVWMLSEMIFVTSLSDGDMKPVIPQMQFEKRFYNIRVAPEPIDVAKRSARWSDSRVQQIPVLIYEGRVITDPAEAKSIYEAFPSLGRASSGS